MKIDKFTIDHYETVCGWWKDYEWNPIPLESLPTTGFIVDDVCAGFLYKTDSNIAWLEFVVSNKKANKEEKSKALNLLIESLCEEAKKDKYNVIFTSCQHKGLIQKYLNNGFIKTDLNMTNLIRSL